MSSPSRSRAVRTRLALLSLVLAALALSGCAVGMRGSMALASGDYDQALALYREDLATRPDSLYLRQRIAYTHFLRKDYGRAEEGFLDILARIPGDPETVFYLGLSRIGKGERAAALDELSRFRWQFKYYHGMFVRDEAVRQLRHPEMGADESIAGLREALDKGREEQDRTEREMRSMRD